MEAVVNYLTNTPTPQLPAIQMSTLPPTVKTRQKFLKNGVFHFIICWGATKATQDGKVNLDLSTTLGVMSL